MTDAPKKLVRITWTQRNTDAWSPDAPSGKTVFTSDDLEDIQKAAEHEAHGNSYDLDRFECHVNELTQPHIEH